MDDTDLSEANHYALQLRHSLGAQLARTDLGDETAVWATLAAAGVLGIAFDEAHGGLSLGVAAMVPVMEVVGELGLSVPFLETVVLAGGLLSRLPTGAGDALLRRIAAGEAKVAFAAQDGAGKGALAATATRSGDGWSVRGRKILVVGAPDAAAIILTAREEGGAVSAFLVDPAATGVAMRAYPTIDGRSAADIEFVDAAAIRLGAAGDALAEVEDEAIAMIAAEAAAIMRALVAATTDYCKQREQFGQSVGSFQTVQHRLVDMHLAAKRAGAASTLALNALSAEGAMRRRGISAAKVTVAETARFVGQQAVQLHGAMGMTEELPVGQRFKRLTVIEAEFGGVDHHLRRYIVASAAA